MDTPPERLIKTKRTYKSLKNLKGQFYRSYKKIRVYYKQLYDSKCENLEEMDTFLENRIYLIYGSTRTAAGAATARKEVAFEYLTRKSWRVSFKRR